MKVRRICASLSRENGEEVREMMRTDREDPPRIVGIANSSGGRRVDDGEVR